MDAVLVKRGDIYFLEKAEFNGFEVIGNSIEKPKGDLYDLSIPNCRAVELGYDLDELAQKQIEEDNPDWEYEYSGTINWGKDFFIKGVKKGLEILGDKKFSEADMINAHFIGWIDRGESDKVQYPKARNNYIESIQENKWDVVVVTEYIEEEKTGIAELSWGRNALKLDSKGCVILKRK